MKPSIFEIILFSGVFHLGLLLFISSAPEVNTIEGNTKIEVEIYPKTSKSQKPLKNSFIRKSLIPRPGPTNTKKDDKIDLTDYANQLKAVVDPVWVRNIQGVHKNYSLICLIFVSRSGSIRSVKVIKSSGYADIDQIAVNTFREVGTLPQPPDIIVEKGIEWELSNQ